VERVQEQPHVVEADPLAEIEALLYGIHEVGLEPIQRFHPQADTPCSRVLSSLPQTLGCPRALLLALGIREQARLARRGVHGADHVGRPNRGGEVDARD
jgi:hypothetical protein